MAINASAPVIGRAEVDVAAAPDAVWGVISGIEDWPSWNPDVHSASLEGELQPGSEFRWKAGPGTITSTLDEVEPPRMIAWRGKTFGIRALHVYQLEPSGDGTRVITEESWDGWPARLGRNRMQGRLETSLRAGLEAVKAEAERRARS